MPAYERHVFVCVNERPEGHPRGCCAGKNSSELRERLKHTAKQYGLGQRVRINNAGCLDQCEHGPTIVVYPEAVWYGFVQPEDVDELVRSHLVEGRPVERLRLPDTCLNNPHCPHREPPACDSPSAPG